MNDQRQAETWEEWREEVRREIVPYDSSEAAYYNGLLSTFDMMDANLPPLATCRAAEDLLRELSRVRDVVGPDDFDLISSLIDPLIARATPPEDKP